MESKGPLWDRGVCRVEETIQGDEETIQGKERRSGDMSEILMDDVNDEEMVKVDYEYEVHSTPLAVLLHFFGVGEVWLPYSQIEVDEDRGVVKMPEWLAFENELI